MKRVLITGVNRGLGKELFDLFMAKGYYVYGILRNQSVAERIRNELPGNGRILLADLLSDNVIDTIKAEIGTNTIDLLINNAGVGGNFSKIAETESEEIYKLINIHCLGALRTVKALKENLLDAQKPIVVNINSRLGSISQQSLGVYKDLETSYSYRIAKASQNMLTNCLRAEFNGRIKFISLNPGKMKTAIAHSDADLEPDVAATRILKFYEAGELKEENGIIELGKGLIDW